MFNVDNIPEGKDAFIFSIVPSIMFRINSDYFNIFIKNYMETHRLDLRKKAITSLVLSYVLLL